MPTEDYFTLDDTTNALTMKVKKAPHHSRLEGPWYWSNKFPGEIQTELPATSHPAIKSLTWKNRHVPPATITGFVIQFPNLQTLNLSSTSITDGDISTITQACVQLKHLVLNECKALTPTALSVIGANCKALEKISLEHHSIKEVDIVLSLVECCPDLQSIHLENTPVCTMINNGIDPLDSAFKAFATLFQARPFLHLGGVTQERIEQARNATHGPHVQQILQGKAWQPGNDNALGGNGRKDGTGPAGRW